MRGLVYQNVTKKKKENFIYESEVMRGLLLDLEMT